MTPTKLVLTTLVTLGMAVGVAASSRIPYAQPGHDIALLRLSWRYRGEKIQSCRRLSQKELDALPIHMRTPEVCTTRLLQYQLQLQVDDAQPDVLRFQPAGAKGDRPIFVYYGKALNPGVHRVRVEFAPVGEPDAQKHALRYEGDLTARRGYVNLISLENGAFIVEP